MDYGEPVTWTSSSITSNTGNYVIHDMGSATGIAGDTVIIGGWFDPYASMSKPERWLNEQLDRVLKRGKL